jgi:hypothetical protein
MDSTILKPKSLTELSNNIKQVHDYVFIHKFKDFKFKQILKMNIGFKRKFLFFFINTFYKKHNVIYFPMIITYITSIIILYYYFPSIKHITNIIVHIFRYITIIYIPVYATSFFLVIHFKKWLEYYTINEIQFGINLLEQMRQDLLQEIERQRFNSQK